MCLMPPMRGYHLEAMATQVGSPSKIVGNPSFEGHYLIFFEPRDNEL